MSVVRLLPLIVTAWLVGLIEETALAGRNCVGAISQPCLEAVIAEAIEKRRDRGTQLLHSMSPVAPLPPVIAPEILQVIAVAVKFTAVALAPLIVTA